MNRSSRRSADEAAERLLDAGRTQPVLQYDVELGLARHHHWLQSEAPMPEWASASVSTAAKSVVPIAIKTIVSAVLIGGLALAGWHARSRPQPSAAEPEHSVAPSEAWMATTPIPVSAQDLPSDQPTVTRERAAAAPARRAVRADVTDKRIPRVQRAHKEAASVRAAIAPAVSAAEPEATPDRAEPAAVDEHEPISTANTATPEPAPRAQAPDDLAEMQQVATAEQLLERSPERALALVHQGDRRFARGYFQQERAYIAIMALIRLGRIDEARAHAASFDKQFPALPYGARIRSALDAAH